MLDSLVHVLEAVVGVDVAHGVVDGDSWWGEAVLLCVDDHLSCGWCDVDGDHVWCVNSNVHRSISFSLEEYFSFFLLTLFTIGFIQTVLTLLHCIFTISS